MTTTPRYQLNQWDAEDYIRRVDFNRDNERIEAALTAQAQDLENKVSACKDSINAGNAAWKQALETETSERKNADSAEASARAAAISSEVSARNSAISSAVAAEKSAREKAISDEVTNRNSAINSAVASEKSARENADATERSVMWQAVNAEAAARNTALTNSIATEVNNRNSAISKAISAEVTDRNNAINSAVAAERSAREQAISSEASARANAVSALQQAVDSKVNTVQQSIGFQLLQDFTIQQDGLTRVSLPLPDSYWSDWKAIHMIMNLKNYTSVRFEDPTVSRLNLKTQDWWIVLHPHYDPTFALTIDYNSTVDHGRVISVTQKFQELHTVYFQVIESNGNTIMQPGARFRFYGEK